MKRRILIVCEGKKTEPQYFESLKNELRLSAIDIKVEGSGYNTKSLVDYTVKLVEYAEEETVPYDEVWCVFDRDDFTAENFNNAIQKANAKKFKVAYSNQAFELWYLLHYIYCDSSLHRDEYSVKLSEHLGCKYEKNDRMIQALLRDKCGIAVRNAKRLLQTYGNFHNPEKDNPSTTVHILVETLLALKQQD